MVSCASPRYDARQISILVAATFWAILLLVLAPGAHGDIIAKPNVDENPGGHPYVAGELLVVYEPGTSEETEQAVVRGLGGRSAEDLSGGMRLVSFPGIARERSKRARERSLQRKLQDLRDVPEVEAADYNHIYKASSFAPNDPKFGGQWGLKKPTFPRAWSLASGAGAKIAIVDSGIDRNHPDIGNISAERDFVSGDAVANDPFGHGTHVAGITAALTDNGKGVAGGCPACKLLIARVLDANGSTDGATLAKGINWSVNNKADVINLSLDGPADNDVVKTAVNDASASGAVVVAAAGNQGTTALRYPAAYAKVIAVSATNENDGLASFSSRGSWVDLAAPGTNILSTGAGGGYYEESGTSESAPFVSALAGLLDSEGKTASEIRQRMQSTATDLGPSGYDPHFGYGRIDANRAVS